MILRAERSKVARSAIPWRTAATLILAALAAAAQAQPLPPRSQWQASSSSQQVPAMAISHLIDGDRRPSPAAPSAPATGSRSIWARQPCWLVHDSPGMSPTRKAIHCRPHWMVRSGRPRTRWPIHWAMWKRCTSRRGRRAIYDLPVRSAPPTGVCRSSKWSRWTARSAHASPMSMQHRQPRSGEAAAPCGSGRKGGSHALEITLPQAQSTAGLVVDWADGARGARLQAQDEQGRWQDLAHDAQAANHRQSWLAADTAQPCVRSG